MTSAFCKKMVFCFVLVMTVCTVMFQRPAYAEDAFWLTLVPASDSEYVADIVRICDADMNVCDVFSEPISVLDIESALKSDNVVALSKIVKSDAWIHVSSDDGHVDVLRGWYIVSCASGVYSFVVDAADIELIEKPVVVSIFKEVSLKTSDKFYSLDDVLSAHVSDKLRWHIVVNMPISKNSREIVVSDSMIGSVFDTSTVKVLCDDEVLDSVVDVTDTGFVIKFLAPAFANRAEVYYDSSCSKVEDVKNTAQAEVRDGDLVSTTGEAYASARVSSVDEFKTKPQDKSSVASYKKSSDITNKASADGSSGSGELLAKTSDISVNAVSVVVLGLCFVGFGFYLKHVCLRD